MSNGPTKPSNHHHLSSYSKPEADYQQIVQNPDIFLQKLRSFNVFYGTKFRVPTLGGNRLDLHRLFLEVTSRGGIQKVITDRKWKEVTGIFNFPTSITNASFTLRKYYLSLLYHFEQAYYFRKEKPSTPEVDQGSNGSPLLHAVHDDAASNQQSGKHKLGDQYSVTGTIDVKFDDGYLVTVTLGPEVFKGVLYHIPSAQGPVTTAPVAPVSVQPNVSQNFIASDGPVKRGKRKQRSEFKDPAHPKRNRSGYTFFYAEQYPRLRPLYKGQERAIRSKAISTKIGQLWSRLTDDEKQVYQDKGKRDKERYQAEMLEYKLAQGQE